MKTLEVFNQISTLLCLLQTGEDHLSSWDILLRVQEVGKHVLLVPLDSRGLVSISISESSSFTSIATIDSEKVWTLLMNSTLYKKIIARMRKNIKKQTCSTVWHCAHLVLKILAPLAAFPAGMVAKEQKRNKKK